MIASLIKHFYTLFYLPYLSIMSPSLLAVMDQHGGGLNVRFKNLVYEFIVSTFFTILQVCDRMMPGYGEQMRAISLKYVPTAVLSRQTAGLRGKSLIMNLPGKPKSIRETIDEVFVSVPACITLLEGPYIETNDDVVKAFRPKNLIRQA